MKPHRPYQLQEYNPAWKEIFSKTAEKLKPILGDNLLEIEHIGSTSIEGMFAKPQIDIMVTVKDLSLIKECYDSLTKAGFVPRGTEYVGIGDEYVTEDAPDGTRLASIHIFQAGHPEIARHLIFRDYLRENKQDRELYISTKKDLYSKYSEDYAKYDSGKHNVITEIHARAEKWHSLKEK